MADLQRPNPALAQSGFSAQAKFPNFEEATRRVIEVMALLLLLFASFSLVVQIRLESVGDGVASRAIWNTAVFILLGALACHAAFTGRVRLASSLLVVTIFNAVLIAVFAFGLGARAPLIYGLLAAIAIGHLVYGARIGWVLAGLSCLCACIAAGAEHLGWLQGTTGSNFPPTFNSLIALLVTSLISLFAARAFHNRAEQTLQWERAQREALEHSLQELERTSASKTHFFDSLPDDFLKQCDELIAECEQYVKAAETGTDMHEEDEKLTRTGNVLVERFHALLGRVGA